MGLDEEGYSHVQRQSGALTIALLMLGMRTSSVVPRSELRTDTQPTDKAVAAKALKIVSDIHGSWQQMPGNIVSGRMTSGALIGNGSVGVAIGGTADKQQFYIGRDDFWSVLRGSIMPVGRLQLTVPSLQGGTSQLSENIGPADVTGSFAQGNSQLKTQSWVAAGQNIVFIQLENSGHDAIAGKRGNARRLRPEGSRDAGGRYGRCVLG